MFTVADHSHCWYCSNAWDAGEHQVGDRLSGGPEQFFTCSKDRNPSYYMWNHVSCPDRNIIKVEDDDYGWG
jgi:hypothetical protein